MSLLGNAALLFGVLVIIFALFGIGQIVELFAQLNDKSVQHKKKVRREYRAVMQLTAILTLFTLMFGGVIVYINLVNPQYGWIGSIVAGYLLLRFLRGHQSAVALRYQKLRQDYFDKSKPPQENIPD